MTMQREHPHAARIRKVKGIPLPSPAPSSDNPMAAFEGHMRAIARQAAADLIPEVIAAITAQGWKPPVSPLAFVAEDDLRQVIGLRRGSPMAPQTFVSMYITTGVLTRVSAQICGNFKKKYVYFSDIQKVFPEQVTESLRGKIKYPSQKKP